MIIEHTEKGRSFRSQGCKNSILLQRSAEVDSPVCENDVGKLRQKEHNSPMG